MFNCDWFWDLCIFISLSHVNFYSKMCNKHMDFYLCKVIVAIFLDAISMIVLSICHHNYFYP